MKAITLRISAAAGLCSLFALHPAHALSPAETNAADTIKVYVASGETLTFITSVNGSACSQGSIDVYLFGGLEPTWANWIQQGQFSAYSCRLRSDLTGPYAAIAGRKIAFYESSEEGASGAVIQGTGAFPARPQLRFVNVFPGGCNSLPQPAGALPSWRCSSPNWQTPHFGLSEVSPDRIRNINVFAGRDNPGDGLEPSHELGGGPVFQRVYGLTVTPNLYRAMQQAQGLAQNDDAANRPTLSRTVAASMFSGHLGVGREGRGWQYLVGTTHPLAASQVNICRGRNGSGMQAVVNDALLGFCGTNGTSPASADWSDTPNGRDGLGTAGNLQVVETVGENELEYCMATAQERNAFAIGAFSVGRRHEVDHASFYRYVKLDGVEPGAAAAKLGEGLMSDVHMVWGRLAEAAWPGDVGTAVRALFAEVLQAEHLTQVGSTSLRTGVLALPSDENVFRGGSVASQTYTGASMQSPNCSQRVIVAPL